MRRAVETVAWWAAVGLLGAAAWAGYAVRKARSALRSSERLSGRSRRLS